MVVPRLVTPKKLQFVVKIRYIPVIANFIFLPLVNFLEVGVIIIIIVLNIENFVLYHFLVNVYRSKIALFRFFSWKNFRLN
jgi:hypothetical protein